MARADSADSADPADPADSAVWSLSLRIKLAGAFLAIALVTVALVALVIERLSIAPLSQTVAERERAYLATGLAEFYAHNRSWDNIRPTMNRLLTGAPPGASNAQPAPGGPDPTLGPPALFGVPAVVDAGGVVVLPIAAYPRGSVVPPDVLARDGTPILVDGQRVGWVLSVSQSAQVTRDQAVFVELTRRALALGSAGGMAAALVIGLVLAQTMTGPLRRLTDAARRMAQGSLEQEVAVRSRDELGRLAAAFNHMSREVAAQTRLRRQMAADIAHDLRTPLTAVAGYLEAMEAGDLAPTRERLRLVYGEVQRLEAMVADLRLLSQADARELRLNLQPLPAAAVVERAVAAHRRRAEQRGILLLVGETAAHAQVRVDEARMARVFDNLVDNALEHTPAGGRIEVAAGASGDRVVFTVRDTGPGVPPDKLPHLFDRFYRADESRGADRHSGLGLAIVRALVEAHGGTVRAASRPGEGTEMIATLPALPALPTHALLSVGPALSELPTVSPN
jgi:signal transduction histidine kinase